MKVLWLSEAIETLNRKHTNNANDLLPLVIFAIDTGYFSCNATTTKIVVLSFNKNKNAFIRCNKMIRSKIVEMEFNANELKIE